MPLRLVAAAHDLADDAGRARRLPVTLGVPHHFDAPAAARLAAAIAAHSLAVEFSAMGPADRRAALSTGRVQLALEHVEPDRASWSSPLGVGGTSAEGAGAPFFLSELRPRRGTDGIRRLWLQPEDDVPNVRDRLERVRNGAGLVPGHLRFASTLVDAMSQVLATDDLALCTPSEADAFGLAWQPLGDLHLVRGYALTHRDRELAHRFADAARPHVAAVLGATETAAPRAPARGRARSQSARVVGESRAI